MSNIKLSGEDVLNLDIQTIEEAEGLLKKADYMENLAFWVRGKSYKAIRDIIDEGHSEYTSFKEYIEQTPVGVSYTHANRLIQAFNQVEDFRSAGTPDNELPKTERACRDLRPKRPIQTPKPVDLINDTMDRMDEVVDRLKVIYTMLVNGEKPEGDKGMLLTESISTMKIIIDKLLEYEK